MLRKEFEKNVLQELKDNNIKKPVQTKKHTFYITDDNGNKANFQVKGEDKEVMYTLEDVNKILGACIKVASDALANGGDVSIQGFGSLRLHYRKSRKTKNPATGEALDIRARYGPKFFPGKDLKMAARMYELTLESITNKDNVYVDELDMDGDTDGHGG